MTVAPGSALQCFEVSKTYPIQKELRAWRILLGMRVNGQLIQALDGITLDVPRGKILGVLGKNGAGKSTLLRILGGVYEPSSGEVLVNGQIAGLFELGGMGNPNLTGREYAVRYLRIMGVKSDDVFALLQDILEFSELGGALDQRIRTYSSGMQARLYFATATALRHEIYLIDELLSVGDEHFQAKCWQRMRQRLLNGASGVLVTHDWAAILRLCERTSLIERGRFIFTGPSDTAVVRYLDLPRPEAGIAKFSKRNLGHYTAISGQDASFQFEVNVEEAVAVDFAMSIEMLRIGLGWEIVLLSDALTVTDKSGICIVTVSIPCLPLAPGSYSINVFLTKRRISLLDPAVTLDARTWTSGNGFSLEVKGEALNVAVKLPFSTQPLRMES
jgi:lipopolysaccharide transport system ATP-binding protein